MSVHRRQFIIGPRPLKVRPEWVTIPLDAAGSMHLSHCPELPVCRGDGSGRRSFVLIGDALSTQPDGPTPEEIVMTAATAEEVVRASRGWFGRWLMVLGGEVHLDACGLLGCMYRRTGEGHVWLSSSPGLLVRSDVSEEPYSRAPQLEWEVGFDFYPAPHTGFSCVRRLLPSQVIDVLAEGHPIRPRPLPGPEQHVGPSDAMSLLDRITELLTGGMQAAEQRFGALWLPLTGGYDSRLLLAAARHAGVEDVTAYTHAYAWPKLPHADRVLPPRLARAAGYRHRLITPGETSEARLQMFDAHTGTGMQMSDRAFWGAGQWDAVPPDVAVMRGAAFEIAVCVYYREIPSNQRQIPKLMPGGEFGAAETIRDAWALDLAHPGSAPHREGLEEWEAWMHATPNEGVDWRDRLYLEQRVGAWAADIEQALDITGTHRVLLANCHALLSAALSLPLEWRTAGTWQVKLISRMAPGLADFPINPDDGALQRAAQRVQWETRMIMASHRKPAYIARRTRQVFSRIAADRRRSKHPSHG